MGVRNFDSLQTRRRSMGRSLDESFPRKQLQNQFLHDSIWHIFRNLEYSLLIPRCQPSFESGVWWGSDREIGGSERWHAAEVSFFSRRRIVSSPHERTTIWRQLIKRALAYGGKLQLSTCSPLWSSRSTRAGTDEKTRRWWIGIPYVHWRKCFHATQYLFRNLRHWANTGVAGSWSEADASTSDRKRSLYRHTGTAR